MPADPVYVELIPQYNCKKKDLLLVPDLNVNKQINHCKYAR